MSGDTKETSGGNGQLFQTERHEQIIELAMVRGRVDVGGLAERFGVTTETIRR
ncbi:MAG TPA: DeoR family transcriptional regulator, partial [Acidimicrobiia bacterium]|nr:DeoR family transcriptional regulator [Acidimicrobiia bacterium]